MKRELKQFLRISGSQLEASDKQLSSIFRIMFRARDNILCEVNDGFRIQKITYGQMHDRICRTAASLYAKIGATDGYVGLEMENCPDWIAAFWAILMSGNKPYLVNMRYPASLTNGILQTLQVQYVICAEDTQLNATAIAMKDLDGDYPAVPQEVFADELAFSSSATSMNEVICYYSGYQISQQILNFRGIVKENPRIAKHYKGSLKQLAFLPFYHVFGLFAVYFWFTFFGRTLVFLRDYAADTILKTCRRHQVTHIFAVPMLWHTIEKQVRSEAAKQGAKKEAKLKRGLAISTALQNLFPNLGAAIAKRLMRQVTGKLFGNSVMFCINGGSYLRDSAMELLNGIGYCMHNGYGMSEIGITSVELRHRPKDRNRNSIGHPFDSVEYRLDADGFLQVKGSSLCTKKVINGQLAPRSEWFDTGDHMSCADGHYYIHGRRSDTVIGENGENINPDMIEKAFMPERVKMLSVLGLPGPDGQELSLVAQVSPYTTAAAANEIKQEIYAVNETFPAATAVRKFYFTFDELAPPTAVKVSRAQLTKKIADGQVQLTAFQAFQPAGSAEGQESPLLRQVRLIIAKELDVPEADVQPQTHIFYDLGATSIQYFSILGALSQHFDISNYDSNDKYCYTPAQICDYLERRL